MKKILSVAVFLFTSVSFASSQIQAQPEQISEKANQAVSHAIKSAKHIHNKVAKHHSKKQLAQADHPVPPVKR